MELKPEIQLYFARVDFLLKLDISFDDVFVDPDCGREKTEYPLREPSRARPIAWTVHWSLGRFIQPYFPDGARHRTLPPC